MASTKKWEDLDISNDEAKRLCDAFQNEEFRKMFIEYAEELQDPENRKRYEEELAMLEGEKGMDVKFVHPEPGYVMKTIVDGSTKAFINICKNEHVGKPEMSKAIHPQTGRLAPNWSVPHTLAPPRDDTDKGGEKCRVFDVVFHPDAYRMGESNNRFRKMLNDTALETIERQFSVKLDKTNVKFPKIKFKGTPQATVIRTKKEDDEKAKGDPADSDKVDDILSKIPYPYDNKTGAEKAKENEENAKKRGDQKKEKEAPDAEIPKYSIVHRQEVDFQDYRDAPDARASTRPKEIVIQIELPLLKSASSANLDIFEKRVLLESTTPAKYKLDLDLPYPVDENGGSAKFDKSKRRLTVTLPVLKPDISELSVNGTGITKSKENGSQNEQETSKEENGEDDVPELQDVPELEDDVPETNGSPLIQVLSSTTNETQKSDEINQKPLTNGHVNHDDPMPNGTDIWTEEDFDSKYTTPTINYKLPDYVANQDQETTTFILTVKKVQRDSLSKTFGDNSVQLRFVSVGSGGYPMHYSFTVKFEDDSLIDTTACDISMSDDNVVMILGKTSEAAGIWDKFMVGTDADHLEEALFVTEKTLSSALDQLDANTMPLNNNDKMPDLEVTDMSDDQLTIQLSNAANQEKIQRIKKHSESSDDIEVVHSGEAPSLHGILKDRARTVSESSDEVFGVRGAYRREDSVSSILSTGSASEGLYSESEGDSNTPSRKKSVSFSEFVDRTTYKSNASVSTLHASLKKKNKRCRKKEAKIERRRRRSSGSECEHSSEDQSSQIETSEGGADTAGDEDDDDDVIVDHQLPEGPRTVPDDEEEETAASVVAAPAQAKQPAKKNKKSKKKGSKGKKAAATASKEGFSENVNAASHTPPETKSESVTSEEGESGVECVANPEDGERTKVNGESEDCDSDDAEPGESESAPKRTTEPKHNPDSALSWEDAPICESDVTKCAFKFTNDMMFDLDDD